jgi:hypothetical protein
MKTNHKVDLKMSTMVLVWVRQVLAHPHSMDQYKVGSPKGL